MLTKKDFKAIARIMVDERSNVSLSGEEDRIDGISLALAEYLSGKNPAFNREKFLKACGTQAETSI